MTATDVENQAVPLVQNRGDKTNMSQPLFMKTVQSLLAGDKHQELQNRINVHGKEEVWRPRREVESGHIFNTFHEAAKKGAKECMRVLLESSPTQELLDEPNKEGNTPLMLAVQEAHYEVVDALLKAKAHINARNNKGHTALHLLAIAIADGDKEEVSLENTAKLLLNDPNIDLEPHSYSGWTPLFTAASFLPKDSDCLKDFCRKLVKAGASVEDNAISENSKRALAEVIRGVERKPAPERPAQSLFLDMFTRKKSAEDIKNFLTASEGHRSFVNCRLGSSSLLFQSVDSKNESLVQILLELKANVWTKEITKELPLHRAAAVGHVSIFEHLIKSMKNKNPKLDLKDHSFLILKKLLENTKRRRRTSTEIDHNKCLERLLQNDIELNVNDTYDGQTVLHEAIAFNNQKAAAKLMSRGSFLGAHRFVNKEDYGTILDSVHLSTLERAMDACVTHSPTSHNEEDEEFKNVFSPDYTLKLDYRFLIPPVEHENKGAIENINELETVMEIGKRKDIRRAIMHPLVETLLYAKWRKAMGYYFANVFMYLFFVVCLGIFGYMLKELRLLEASLPSENSSNQTVLEARNSTLIQMDELQVTTHILRVILLIMVTLMSVREAFQIYFNWSRYYKNIENLFECFLILVVIILAVAPLPVDSTRHLVAWAMIIAGYEFVLILGRVPFLAIYITMMRRISWDFCKMIILYGSLFVAFAFSFYILQPTGNEEFSNFWSALPKAIVMATGEFDYSGENYNFSREAAIFVSTIMIFLVFLFLVYLVVVNVLLGLAVDETKRVLEDQKLFFLLTRLELVYLVETFFRFCPGFKKQLEDFQFLKTRPSLKVKINQRSKGTRLISERGQSRLGDETCNELRKKRLEMIEEEE